MAKFKYKFEVIKEIKERLEKKAQKELAVIELDIASKKEELQELSKKLKEQKSRKIANKIKKTAEYHFDEKYESYLVEQIGLIQKGLIEKRIERNKKMDELMQKSKETKTFEKLKENHFSHFIKLQEKLDQKEMDEIAVNEFLKES